MKIAGRGGHNPGVPGTHGIVDEIAEDRLYWCALMGALKIRGNEVLDCTPPGNTKTTGADLTYGVNKANAWKADLYVSCHVNGFDSLSHGCEVIYQPGSVKGKEYAVKVNAALVALGFKDRKAYADVRGLYEIKNLKMPCIIVEPFFCDNKEDVALYKKLGPVKIADTIATAITGKAAAKSTETPYPLRSVVADVLNVRSSSDTINDRNIIGQLKKGDKVKVGYDRKDGWSNIFYGMHGGWVATRYLK